MKPSYFKISFGEGLCLRLGLTGPLVDSIAAPGALLLITIPVPGPYPSPTGENPPGHRPRSCFYQVPQRFLRASQVALEVKNPPAHSSILA